MASLLPNFPAHEQIFCNGNKSGKGFRTNCPESNSFRYEDNGMQQFDKHFVSSPFEILHYKGRHSRVLPLHDLRGSTWIPVPGSDMPLEGMPNLSPQQRSRHSKVLHREMRPAGRGQKTHQKPQDSDLQIWSSGSSDLYTSEKPVGLSIQHLGYAKQINRATAKPMLFAVVGMGAKRTMPWRRKFGKANRTTMKH